MKSERARQLLGDEVFQAAINEIHEYYLSQVKQNPLDCDEAATALSVIDKILAQIKSMSLDDRINKNSSQP